MCFSFSSQSVAVMVVVVAVAVATDHLVDLELQEDFRENCSIFLVLIVQPCLCFVSEQKI